MIALLFVEWCIVCHSATGAQLLHPRRRSLQSSSSSSRLLSLAEARARDAEAKKREHTQSMTDHGFYSSSLPSKYRSVFDEPKRSDFILLCDIVVIFCIMPGTLHFILRTFTQSLSSFHSTCPCHQNLFCCSTEIMSSNPSLSLNPLLGTLSCTGTNIYTSATCTGYWIQATFTNK